MARVVIGGAPLTYSLRLLPVRDLASHTTFSRWQLPCLLEPLFCLKPAECNRRPCTLPPARTLFLAEALPVLHIERIASGVQREREAVAHHVRGAQ
mmetsp:Transcript_22577/g.73812  ORF Transcript_22577/g.73812 Transcript_22577/m.73812 type:complete len:96 (-) Transcript_22577:286-573(-)